MHEGDFSALTAAGGASYAIYDPATRIKLANGRFQQTAFPSNLIPKARFDPVGSKILGWYPTQTKAAGDAYGRGNYADASTAEYAKYWNGTFRIDQNLGDRQRFFVRASAYRRDSTYNDYFESAFTGQQFLFDSKAAVFDHVYTLSPTMVLNTRYSYNRFIRGSDGNKLGEGFDLSQLGFSSQYVSQVPKDIARFPRINLTGYISNGFTGELRPVMNHTVSATLTKAAGKHSIRSGFEFRAYQEADKFFSNAQTGQFTFDSTYTRGPLDNSAASPSSIGQSVASLLLGLPGSGSIARSADYIEQSESWGFFIQDDWKIARKLTLNLGLRYEFETPMTERFNRSTLSFDPSYTQTISAAAQAAYATIYPNISGGFPQLPVSAFALKGGMTFAGIDGNNGNLYKTPKNVFLPRVGLAYQLTPKTVLRSGVGMFAGFLGERRGDVIQNGFSQNTNMVLTTDSGLTWATTLANPFKNGISEPKGNSDGYATYLGQGFSFFNQTPEIPVTARWELGLQQELKGYSFEMNYIGSKTVQTEVTRNINALPLQYWSTLRVRDDVNNNYLSANISNPMRGLVTGNTQGTYTSSNITRQTLLSPYRAFARTPSTRQRTAATPGTTAFNYRPRSAFRRATPSWGATPSRSGCRPPTCSTRSMPGQSRRSPTPTRPTASTSAAFGNCPSAGARPCWAAATPSYRDWWAAGSSPASGACKAASRWRGATPSIMAIRRTSAVPWANAPPTTGSISAASKLPRPSSC